MKQQSTRALAFVVATAAVVTGVVFLATRVLERQAPEGEILTAMKRLEVTCPDAALASGTLHAARVRLDFPTVAIATDGASAWVAATLDFDGTFAGEVRVSSLGVERIQLLRRADKWEVAKPPFPTLSGIVGVLSARNRGATAWFIRSERGAVIANEQTPQGTQHLTLEWQDGAWKLTG